MTDRGDGLAWLRGAGEPRLLADIVATVDLDRALTEAGPAARRAGHAPADILLGARVALVDDGAATLAIAEPTTEGRLAASLAKAGEGIAGAYLAAPVDLDTVRALAAAAGVTLSRRETGPFGPEVLVIAATPAGPHVVLVDPRALPSPG